MTPVPRPSKGLSWIGVGRTGLVPGPSSLRTVHADFPHTALQSVVHRIADWYARPQVSRMVSSPRAARKTPDLHVLHHLDLQAASTRSDPPQVPPVSSNVPELGVSALLSPSSGHSRRSAFLRYALLASTFLRPFAPRALPRFIATMAALTPGCPALRPDSSGVNTVHTPARSP